VKNQATNSCLSALGNTFVRPACNEQQGLNFSKEMKSKRQAQWPTEPRGGGWQLPGWSCYCPRNQSAKERRNRLRITPASCRWGRRKRRERQTLHKGKTAQRQFHYYSPFCAASHPSALSCPPCNLLAL